MRNSMKALPLVRGIAILAGCALAALGSATSARAATPSVSNLNDSGPGSLRQAIADAAAGDTITFGVRGTITLTSGALTITQDLDIEGPGPNKLKISGNHASRVFVIQGTATQPVTVTLARMTITGGRADANSAILPSIGGGILVLSGVPYYFSGGVFNLASLTLSNDVVSDNAAVGNASASPFGATGWAIGGGIASFGTLEVKACQLTGNLARGGDGIGVAVGGAIGNWGPASLTRSQFIRNVSQGGTGGSDLEAGNAIGGAIGNAGALTVTGSTFSDNQAVGGNETSGSISGRALGGAIYTGGAGQPSAMLVAKDSGFYDNQAIGGNNGNLAGVAGGWAAGGAILAIKGPGTISNCTLGHNEALGGAGGLGANGGLVLGGAMSVANDFGLGSNVTVSNSTVEHNAARSGPGGPGGNGGEARGGGLVSGDAATLTVISTTVAHNHAQGGDGGDGGTGGNGLGGGLYDDASSTLTLLDATVSHNFAVGGEAAGQGIGGGVYRLGTFSFDRATEIEKNHASTSQDNIAP